MTGNVELEKILKSCHCGASSSIIRAGMELDKLQALLVAANEVCGYAEHALCCTSDTNKCLCGLEQAEEAYNALKGKSDAE